jgi:hypothetical protein
MRRITLCVCLTLPVVGLVAPSSRQPNVSVNAVTKAAVAYVAEYQQQFKFLIADEAYAQQTFDASRRQTDQRMMHGELFLTFLPTDREWIAVHDVADVDGLPVEDRDDLRALLQNGSVMSVARRLADRNARFNIGRVGRNFNEPTLGLLVLEAKRVANFTFSAMRVERDRQATLVTLGFAERDRPTLVHGTRGQSVLSRGEITVEADTGRVRHTHLVFSDGPLSADLTTDYGRDTNVDLWVPSVFTEHYEVSRPNPPEWIVCEATYTNYRRFDVTVRIK